MSKEKIIFFAAIGLVILIMVIYGLTAFSDKEKRAATKSDFAVPELVEKEQTRSDYSSRLKNANAYQEPKEQEDLSRKIEFKTYEPEQKDEPKQEEPVKVTTKKQIVNKPETKEAGQEENKSEDIGGFGIIVSDKTEKKTAPASDPDGAFYPAMLEENVKIKNQSSVVFFLLQDIKIDGSLYKKNSILYGKAVDLGSIFDIKIYQIIGTDGKGRSISGLVVYDEKYSRGLPYEGNLNESIKEGASQTTNETSSILSSGITNTGVDIAANAVDNTVKALTRRKEASINLYKGYKVFIKKE